MGDVSKNFNESEFKCSCCGSLNLDKRLVVALQILRDRIGLPIKVNSGFRCPIHNRKIGGARASQHIYGTAADIVIKGLKPECVAVIAETIPDFEEGGIGRYDTFTHLDVRKNGPARWNKTTTNG